MLLVGFRRPVFFNGEFVITTPALYLAAKQILTDIEFLITLGAIDFHLFCDYTMECLRSGACTLLDSAFIDH
jgi:hypothetical protein